MKNILFIPSNLKSEAIVYYRCIQPATFLNNNKYANVKVLTSFRNDKGWIDYSPFEWADVIVTQRFYSDNDFLKLLRKGYERFNGFKVYDTDDLVWDIPYKRIRKEYKKTKDFTDKIINEADVITCPTEYLKEQIIKKRRNRCRVDVIPNSVDNAMWDFDRPNHKKPVILYAAGGTHWKEIKFIKKVLKKIKEHYDVETILLSPYFKEKEDEIWNHVYDFVPFKNFPEFMMSLSPDIGIAPIVKKTPFMLSKCLVGDELIVSKNGVKKICDVNIGDKLYQNYNKFEEVKDKFEYKKQKTLKITTYDGYEIEGTLNHKIQDKNGEWKELSQLKIGDELKINFFDFPKTNYQEIRCPFLLTKKLVQESGTSMPIIRIDENWGRLLGYFVGDGSFSGNGISITCDVQYPDIIEDIQRIAKEIGLRVSTYVKNKKDKRWTKCRRGGISINISSRNLVYLFEKLGLTRSENRNGLSKRICTVPNVILSSPKSVIKEFLKGLWEADGTITKAGRYELCSFCTVHKSLAKTVQFLLLGFGIESRLKERKMSSGFHTDRKFYYTVSLRSEMRKRFEQEINFISEKKKNRINKFNSAIKDNRGSMNVKIWDGCDKIVKIINSENDVFDVNIPNNNFYIASGFVSHNSEIKYLDFTQAGAASVLEDCATYNKVENALKANTLDEYYNSIIKLLDNKVRNKFLEDARAEVWRKYDIHNNIKLWEKAIKNK